MTLWRIQFFEDESEDFLQLWFASEKAATDERKKLVDDGITKSSKIDMVMFPTKDYEDRITKPGLVKFLNTYALVSGT